MMNKYERCALLIVDFSKEIPKIYNTSEELKEDGLIYDDFALELGDISFVNLLKIYCINIVKDLKYQIL